MDCPAGVALAESESLRPAWTDALAAEGLTCTKVGFDVRHGDAAGAYVAKEMLGQHTKKGRKGSRTPWQLLEDAGRGDAEAGRLFQEYARCFKGRRQLTWSPGLKQRLGVQERSDSDLAAEDARGEMIVFLSFPEWARVVRAKARAGLLDAAEAGGAVAVRAFIEGLPP